MYQCDLSKVTFLAPAQVVDPLEMLLLLLGQVECTERVALFVVFIHGCIVVAGCAGRCVGPWVGVHRVAWVGCIASRYAQSLSSHLVPPYGQGLPVVAVDRKQS